MNDLQASLLDAIGAAFVAAPYIVVVLLAIGFCIVSLMVWRSPEAGLVMVLVSVCAEALFPGFGLPVGVKVIVPDLACLMLLTRIAFRLPALWGDGTPHRLWVVAGATMLASMLLGVVQFGTRAGIEVRPHLYYWIVATYFMTFRWRDAEALRLLKVFIGGAVAVMLIALYRWAGLAMGFGDVENWNELGTSLRVLDYKTTIVMGLGLIYAMLGRGVGAGAGWGLWAWQLAAGVIVLQHRTAWAAVVIAMGAGMLLSARLRGLQTRGMRWGLVGLVAVAVIVTVAGHDSRLGESLDHSVEEVSSERSTLSWRTQSWQELMKDWMNGGPRVWLVGHPYGAGFNRWIENWGREADVNPHSNYVYLIVRVGVVGTAAMLGSLLLALRELARRRDDAWAVVLAAGIVVQLAGFFSYPSNYSVAFAVGLAFYYLQRSRERQDASVPTAEDPIGSERWSA